MSSSDIVEHVENNHVEEENDDQSSDGNENEAPVSIPSDSVLNKEFPLKYPWGFYFLSNEKNLDWMERLSLICHLKSVEDFWSFIDRIRPPSVMSQCDYSLFKHDIRPVWEEPENKQGGRLVFQLAKQDQQLLNELWLKLMLAMIGSYFGEVDDQICGAVCSSRQKGSKISLWTTDATKEEAIRQIGAKLKEIWGHINPRGSDIQLHYECHSDAQTKLSSAVPRKFTI
ncbi:EIF-4F 25 kDa subunit [Aphelenchoides bicaudatus]|nr:EIF-4F 25 kDa subunit [Aphelenchoides bicaudatus]